MDMLKVEEKPSPISTYTAGLRPVHRVDVSMAGSHLKAQESTSSWTSPLSSSFQV